MRPLHLPALFLLGFLLVGRLHCQDQECLQDFKRSVSDPQNYLDSWTFPPDGNKGICGFEGITCLHENDSTVYGIDLQGAGLSGGFPKGLNKCKSITSLDISGNAFTGPLPDHVCALIPFLVMFKIKGNSFSGDISSTTFANCSYLNGIDLSGNKLSGPLPGEVGVLPRLSSFNVSVNLFTGPIPETLGGRFPESSFQGNPGLCGPPLSKRCGSSGSNVGLIAGVAAGGAVALLAAAVVLTCFIIPTKVRPAGGPGSGGGPGGVRDENRWVKRIRAPHTIPVSMFESNLARMKLTDLLLATDDFSPENIIGSGRTGVVYKASFPDGSLMAIKRLKLSIPHVDKSFKSEMETLGRLRHRNLVPLLGFCAADTEKLLVYAYMPNGSLRDWLHREEDKSSILDWPKRLRIAIGAARGLAWLHHSCNPRIIHRNISSGSILLDEDFEARITDFGLARLMNPVETHISTCINGDFGDVGYVAPEYVRTLVATARGDVFSFGVVLLELITGQGPVEVATQDAFKGNLLEWIALHSQNGTLRNVLDPSLVNGDPSEESELMQFLKIGFCCCAVAPRERPSAFEVYQLLRAIGQRYHFSDQNDEMPMGSSVDSVLDARELIVSSKPEEQV